jgi:putative hydrolase of the HAD superfamily
LLKAVLLDLDDTLFDHRHSSRTALSVLQREFQSQLGCIPLDELEAVNLEILNTIHLEVLAGTLTADQARVKRFGKLLRTYGIDPTEQQLESVAKEYRSNYQLSRRATPGARALLTALRDRGLKTGIVTNNLVEEQMDKLRYCKLFELIDSITISEEAGFAKPDIRIFNTALQRLECKSEETIIIGDSWENDILGARAAGIRGIWYNCYSTKAPDDSVPEIGSLEDFESVLRLL